MGKFGQDAGVTPLLFFEGHPGIFNDHRESGPRFNVSSEGIVNVVLTMCDFTLSSISQKPNKTHRVHTYIT